MPGLRHHLLRVLPIMLLCVLASAVAPRGYMPSMGPDGVHLILCAGVTDNAAAAGVANDAAVAAVANDPGAGALLAALDNPRGEHGDDAGTDGAMACPFAGGATVDLPAIFASPARILVGPVAAELPQTAVVVARHHAARPPATGPPPLI